MRAPTIIALAVVLGGTAYGIAQVDHSTMDHDGHVPSMAHGSLSAPDGPEFTGAPSLTEPGQGAFAALSEVVRVLEADPDTDWSKVDLAGLRDHLRDMDRLVSDAMASEEPLPDGLRVSVTGDAETIGTVQRMVSAHAAQLASDERWKVRATENAGGAELVVTSDDPVVVARIRGLGFFGLMASQDHHREHHMMMARGEDMHAH